MREDVTERTRVVAGGMQSAIRLEPAIADLAPESTALTTPRPMAATGDPIVKKVSRNAVVAAGHGTLGITLAPASAEVVAALVLSPKHQGAPT